MFNRSLDQFETRRRAELYAETRELGRNVLILMERYETTEAIQNMS